MTVIDKARKVCNEALRAGWIDGAVMQGTEADEKHVDIFDPTTVRLMLDVIEAYADVEEYQYNGICSHTLRKLKAHLEAKLK